GAVHAKGHESSGYTFLSGVLHWIATSPQTDPKTCPGQIQSQNCSHSSNLQLAILEKKFFGVVTDAERRKYLRRHDRIRQLYSQLTEMPGVESTSERFNVEPMPRRRNKTRPA